MKALLSFFFSLLLIINVTFYSQKSEAAIGAVSSIVNEANIPSIAAMIGGGGLILLGGKMVSGACAVLVCVAGAIIGGTIAITGAIILDEEEQFLSYEEIDYRQIDKIGLTTNEYNSFNENLYEINTYMQELQFEIFNDKVYLKEPEAIQSFIKKKWNNFFAQNLIENDALSALKKVQKHLSNNLLEN